MLNDGADVEELEPLAEELATDKDEEKAAQRVLWVEKYTPKYFTELLSDDVSTKMLCTEKLSSFTVHSLVIIKKIWFWLSPMSIDMILAIGLL